MVNITLFKNVLFFYESKKAYLMLLVKDDYYQFKLLNNQYNKIQTIVYNKNQFFNQDLSTPVEDEKIIS